MYYIAIIVSQKWFKLVMTFPNFMLLYNNATCFALSANKVNTSTKMCLF